MALCSELLFDDERRRLLLQLHRCVRQPCLERPDARLRRVEARLRLRAERRPRGGRGVGRRLRRVRGGAHLFDARLQGRAARIEALLDARDRRARLRLQRFEARVRRRRRRRRRLARRARLFACILQLPVHPTLQAHRTLGHRPLQPQLQLGEARARALAQPRQRLRRLHLVQRFVLGGAPQRPELEPQGSAILCHPSLGPSEPHRQVCLRRDRCALHRREPPEQRVLLLQHGRARAAVSASACASAAVGGRERRGGRLEQFHPGEELSIAPPHQRRRDAIVRRRRRLLRHAALLLLLREHAALLLLLPLPLLHAVAPGRVGFDPPSGQLVAQRDDLHLLLPHLLAQRRHLRQEVVEHLGERAHRRATQASEALAGGAGGGSVFVELLFGGGERSV